MTPARTFPQVAVHIVPHGQSACPLRDRHVPRGREEAPQQRVDGGSRYRKACYPRSRA